MEGIHGLHDGWGRGVGGYGVQCGDEGILGWGGGGAVETHMAAGVEDDEVEVSFVDARG